MCRRGDELCNGYEGGQRLCGQAGSNHVCLGWLCMILGTHLASQRVGLLERRAPPDQAVRVHGQVNDVGVGDG